LVCGAGGQAALTGKTMKDMGFSNVTNIGGFPAWKDAGGPTEA
jgi:rhodanese-related sulfurtransferase